MSLKEKIKTAPPGTILSVPNEAMQMVRYHARNLREIKSSLNLKTGKRDVLLGEFLF